MFDEPRTDEEKEIAEIEKLIFDVQYEISKSMFQQSVSKAELARRLNCTSASVSQWLGDHGANLTLKTIARIFHALEDECSFHSLVASRSEKRKNSEKIRRSAKSHNSDGTDSFWTQEKIRDKSGEGSEPNVTDQLTNFLRVSNDNHARKQDKKSDRRSWKQAA